MSVKRTPPKSVLLPKTPLTHYGSDSALHSASTSLNQEENYVNVTSRQKHISQATTERVKSISEELKVMFAELKTQQELEFDTLNNAVSTVIMQNENIQKSVDTLSNRYDELLLKANSLEMENSELKEKVSVLEEKLELIEKTNRNSSIEIRNIPKQQKESTQSLSNIVKDIGLVVGLEIPLKNSDIRHIYRAKSEAIVVEFTTVYNKDSLISKFKKLIKHRRENKDLPFRTDEIKLEGPPRLIFISESLTSKTRKLFHTAREYVKNKKIAAAWTSYGKLYVKKQEGSPSIRICEEADLYNIAK